MTVYYGPSDGKNLNRMLLLTSLPKASENFDAISV